VVSPIPFKSKAQQRYMFMNHPEIAKEFAKATPDMKDLPEHVSKKKKVKYKDALKAASRKSNSGKPKKK
jgi:hypothetical protein